jgi:hypothetical protein
MKILRKIPIPITYSSYLLAKKGGEKMAIVSKKEKMALKLELDAGIVDGKQKTTSKTFNNVKVTALDDNLHLAATELAGLQNKPLLNVKKVEETTLTEE